MEHEDDEYLDVGDGNAKGDDYDGDDYEGEDYSAEEPHKEDEEL